MGHLLLHKGLYPEAPTAPISECVTAQVMTPAEAWTFVATDAMPAVQLAGSASTRGGGCSKAVQACLAALARGILEEQAAAQAHTEVVVIHGCVPAAGQLQPRTSL